MPAGTCTETRCTVSICAETFCAWSWLNRIHSYTGMPRWQSEQTSQMCTLGYNCPIVNNPSHVFTWSKRRALKHCSWDLHIGPYENNRRLLNACLHLLIVPYWDIFFRNSNTSREFLVLMFEFPMSDWQLSREQRSYWASYDVKAQASDGRRSGLNDIAAAAVLLS